MNDIERAIGDLTAIRDGIVKSYNITKNDLKHPSKSCHYRVISLEKAIMVLEKQKPKKVNHFLEDDTFETTCCGTDVTNEDYKYCPECGYLLGVIEEVGDENG